ncbi:MAG TPA: sulfite oxidase [Mycobacterium sp.]
MVVHESSSYNAEASRCALAEADVTPVDTFYCRNHGPVPDIAVDDWRLRVDGMADTELSLSFDELTGRYSSHTVVATLQCAGNRRAGFNQVREIVGEDPWGPGATSTAQWRGVRLGDVLRSAGVPVSGHVAFSAPDVSELATPEQTYGSSIPLAKAMADEVLLVWEMNGQPLPRIHGGPVRVVVPGYIGARSVKWLTGVTVQAEPSDNYFQAVAYRILPADFDPDSAGPGDGISLSSVALNCDILTPDEGTDVPAGALTVSGYAFAGDDRGVARVDVSVDDGRTWQQAELGPELSRWAWRRWQTTVEARPGPLRLTARAWDTTGATQPESAASLWNPKGYANNSWAHVQVTVRAS